MLKAYRDGQNIIFCRKYDHTSHLYLYFKHILGKKLTDPIGYPNIARFRKADMYTACTTKDVKEEIALSFTNPNGRLRVMVATVAFGMGLDCPMLEELFTGDHHLTLRATYRKLVVWDEMEGKQYVLCTTLKKKSQVIMWTIL